MPTIRVRGFTLLELIVVLILMMIMAALSVPQLASMVRRAAVQKASGDFIGLTRLARSTACLKQKPVELLVRHADGVFQIQFFEDRKKSSGIEDVDRLFDKNKAQTGSSGTIGEVNPLIARRDLPERVTCLALKSRLKDNVSRVRFNPDGTSENAQFEISGSGILIKLSVDAVSGRARVDPQP